MLTMAVIPKSKHQMMWLASTNPKILLLISAAAQLMEQPAQLKVTAKIQMILWPMRMLRPNVLPMECVFAQKMSSWLKFAAELEECAIAMPFGPLQLLNEQQEKKKKRKILMKSLN